MKPGAGAKQLYSVRSRPAAILGTAGNNRAALASSFGQERTLEQAYPSMSCAAESRLASVPAAAAAAGHRMQYFDSNLGFLTYSGRVAHRDLPKAICDRLRLARTLQLPHP